MYQIVESPITSTNEVWPLAGEFVLRWGCDPGGEMWVAVENPDGGCIGYLPYREYLEQEQAKVDPTIFLSGPPARP